MPSTGKEGVGCDSTDGVRVPTDGMKFKGTDPSLRRGTGSLPGLRCYILFPPQNGITIKRFKNSIKQSSLRQSCPSLNG